MAVHIVQLGESDTLRKKAREVSQEEIGTDAINRVIADMKEALASEADGVAISAPQIDVSLRIFIVSDRAFAIANNEDNADEEKHEYKVFINPVITKMSRKKEWMEEGCLSIRGTYGKVERAQKTTIVALDEHGNKCAYGGSGLISQIFQHETDHLDGILFIDKARDIETIDH